MSKKPALKVNVPVATVPDIFKFNPHWYWDPVGPIDLGPQVAQQLTAIRLQHQRDVTDLQAKALDQAIAAVKSAG
ncbi:MAG TPA: hypothetical protein VMG39_04385 [Pseudolabrys sp.]|nr:hypothetical protein [Pseudolabrys sp.]